MTLDIDQLIRGCESEPLQFSGAIQPHGALLHIARDSGHISHVSANIGAFIEATPEQLLQRHYAECLPVLTEQLAQALTAEPGQYAQLVSWLQQSKGWLDVLMHTTDGGVLAELLPNPGNSQRDSSYRMHGLFREPKDESSLHEYSTDLTRVIQSLTGADRVLAYRFAEDWSGEVIAQSGAGMADFLGLRFPASDIPQIARDLYRINRQRLIADTTAEPVTILGATEQPLDLSLADLRSASPVHLTYLGNMGVQGSFSVAIRNADKLWGLLSLHHSSPLHLPWELRQRCLEVVAHFELGLSSYLIHRRMRHLDRLEGNLARLLPQQMTPEQLFDRLAADPPSLLAVTSSSAAIISYQGRSTVVGRGPRQAMATHLDRWFSATGEDIRHSDRMAAELDLDTDQLALMAGVIATRVPIMTKGQIHHLRIYWLRPEEPLEVIWAGKPEKSHQLRGGVPYLSPRSSFERWTEVTTGQSRPWSQADRMSVMKLRNLALQMLRRR